MLTLNKWQSYFLTNIVDNREGSTDWLYLDPRGLPTIAKGCQVGLAEWVTLPLLYQDGSVASDHGKRIEYARVSAMKYGQKFAATYYKSSASLILPQEACDDLAAKRIIDNTHSLEQIFPKWVIYPDTVKVGTLEIPWGTGFNVFLRDYKKFIPALKLAADTGDYTQVANESGWADPNGWYAERNADRKALILEARNL